MKLPAATSAAVTVWVAVVHCLVVCAGQVMPAAVGAPVVTPDRLESTGKTVSASVLLVGEGDGDEAPRTP